MVQKGSVTMQKSSGAMKSLFLGVLAVLTLALGALRSPLQRFLPDPWPSPVPYFEEGFRLLSSKERVRWLEALELARKGLAIAPGYGPGWLCLAVATERWLGTPFALPLYSLAFDLDPRGRGVQALALPPLLRSGIVPVTAVVPDLLYPEPPPSLIEALPDLPPPSWLNPPAPYSSSFLDPFYRTQRWRWLSALEEEGVARGFSPEARAYTWYGFCQLHPPEDCYKRWIACKGREPVCPRGVSPHPDQLLSLAERARALGELETALAFAQEGFSLKPTARSRDLLIQILLEGKKVERAMAVRALRTLEDGR
jgi:hypothetical protein